MATTPNQFTKHPIPFISMHVLASNETLVKGALDGDYLIVPPPPAYVTANGGRVVRMVNGSSLRGSGDGMLVRNAGAVPTSAVTDVQLILKAEGGREVLLANLPAAVLAVGATTRLIPPNLTLFSTDLGIFLRVANVATVDACFRYFDVRGPTQSFIDVTVVDPTTVLLKENDEEGVVLSSGFFVGTRLYNFDSVAHTFHLYLSNGVDTIELSDTAVPLSIPAGLTGALPFGSGFGFADPSLPEGWSLHASLGEAVVTTAPRIVVGFVPTNTTPVRDDQGGAF